MDNYNLFDAKFRQSLKAACKLFGGQKAVANAAHIKESNLSKWLKGGSTLSPENIDAVLQVMGLPEGKPDSSCLHIWHVNKVDGIDFTPAIKLYFPNGGKIAKSNWAIPGLYTSLKFESENPIQIYAMTDGHTQAILRHIASTHGNWDASLISHLQWRNGSPEASVFFIQESLSRWLFGEPTQSDFLRVWDGLGLSLEASLVIDAIDAEGISYQEAIRRIRKN